MAKVGSTAPVITSPLLAWPARPVSRPSPPLLSPPPTTQEKGKGKALDPNMRIELDSVGTSTGRIRSERLNDGGAAKESVINHFPTTPNTPHFDINTNTDTDVFDEERISKNYAPPSKPLSPQQLGRIAQSFGIVVPSLQPISPRSAMISTSTSSSPSSARTNRSENRRSRVQPKLLTVIPPLSLFPPSSSTDAEERLKVWRRGRLIPLQPTLGGMLLSISREFGLPSTKGIDIYLSHSSSERMSFSSSSSNGDSSENGNGPKISSQTWYTLFSQHIDSSRSSTPSASPAPLSMNQLRKSDYPPTPLSISVPTRQPNTSSFSAMPNPRLRSVSAQHTPTRPTFANQQQLPPTPSSLNARYANSLAPPSPSTVTSNPIVGTIEFDIDPYEATWFVEWVHKGSADRHRRTASTSVLPDGTGTDGSGAGSAGMKELRLVSKTSDSRPRFLKDLDVNQTETFSPKRNATNGTRDLALKQYQISGSQNEMTHIEVGIENQLDPTSSIEMFTLREPLFKSRKVSMTEIDPALEPISTTVSFTHTANSSGELQTPGIDGSEDSHASSSRIIDLQSDIDEEEESDEEQDMNDVSLLAPFSIRDELARNTRFAEFGDKRGSGVMMSEELENLEKLMRQLSPREIRLTSPRMMTPRMASKVANLQFPVQPIQPSHPFNLVPLSDGKKATRSAKSPLVNAFTEDSPPISSADVFPAQTGVVSPVSTNNRPRPSLPPRLDGEHTKFESNLRLRSKSSSAEPPISGSPKWPTVARSKLSSSPKSPTYDDYFSAPRRASPGTAALRGGKSPTSPLSSTRLPPLASPESSLSDETRKRMGSLNSAFKPTLPSEWRPPRPNRPPSPNLQQVHSRTLSHTLSPELVSSLKSPTMASGSLPASPDDEMIRVRQKSKDADYDDKKVDSRGKLGKSSGSVRLRGLRAQMSAKNLNITWKRDEKSVNTSENTDEPVGLFNPNVTFDRQSSFPGLDPKASADSLSITEFGTINDSQDRSRAETASPTLPQSTTGSLPSAVSKGGGMRRMFGGSFTFGRKVSNPGTQHPNHSLTALVEASGPGLNPSPNIINSPILKPKEKEGRSSLGWGSRRHPSHDLSGGGSGSGEHGSRTGKRSISSPIAESFEHVSGIGVGLGSPASPIGKTLDKRSELSSSDGIQSIGDIGKVIPTSPIGKVDSESNSTIRSLSSTAGQSGSTFITSDLNNDINKDIVTPTMNSNSPILQSHDKSLSMSITQIGNRKQNQKQDQISPITRPRTSGSTSTTGTRSSTDKVNNIGQSPTSPISATSPKSVRRKPVPNSFSFSQDLSGKLDGVVSPDK